MKPKQVLGIFLLTLLYCFFWFIMTVGFMTKGISLIYALLIFPIATIVAFIIIGVVIIAVDLIIGD